MHQIYGDGQSKSQKIHHKHRELREKLKWEKITEREREKFHCENDDNKSGFSVVLGFLAWLVGRSIPRSLSCWKGSVIYTGGCYWIRLQSSHLSEHLSYLNCLSWRRLEPNILIWIGRACICHYNVVFVQLKTWLIHSLTVTVEFKRGLACR